MPSVRYHTGWFPPDEGLNRRELVPHIGPAAAALARFDGTLAAIPNPDDLLTQPTVRKAVLSSRIEGIHATVGEVLRFEAGQEPDSPNRC